METTHVILPLTTTFKNVVFNEFAIRNYFFLDGFIKGISGAQPQRAEKIKRSLIQRLNDFSTLVDGVVHLGYDFTSFNFSVTWRNRTTDLPYMWGSMIFNNSLDEFSVNT